MGSGSGPVRGRAARRLRPALVRGGLFCRLGEIQVFLERRQRRRHELLQLESFACFDSDLNSLTSFRWSETMLFMYSRSKSAPESFDSLSYSRWVGRSMSAGSVTPLLPAGCFNWSLDLP